MTHWPGIPLFLTPNFMGISTPQTHLTSSKKEKIMQGGLCFQCGKQGHILCYFSEKPKTRVKKHTSSIIHGLNQLIRPHFPSWTWFRQRKKIKLNKIKNARNPWHSLTKFLNNSKKKKTHFSKSLSAFFSIFLPNLALQSGWQLPKTTSDRHELK